MKELKCLRCGSSMKKHPCYIRFGYVPIRENPFMAPSEQPVAARTVYICESCGCVELNVNED